MACGELDCCYSSGFAVGEGSYSDLCVTLGCDCDGFAVVVGTEYDDSAGEGS